MNALLRRPESLIDLNASCLCIDITKPQIDRAILTRVPNSVLSHELASRPGLFARTAIFLAEKDTQNMLAQIAAIEGLVQSSSSYRNKALHRSDRNVTERQTDTRGLFMGYDFHITEDGPRLIEINTNAGGAFLMAAAMGAEYQPCNGKPSKQFDDLASSFINSFHAEWHAAGRCEPLRTVAIIDEKPTEQFLYPELLIAQHMLQDAGLKATIVDPAELVLENGRLVVDDHPVDLIYNRLTDFALVQSEHLHLQEALVLDQVVISPSPRHHALYADKENLTLFSDRAQLETLGVYVGEGGVWKDIPKTVKVSEANAEDLWVARKRLFFKPTSGFGSRAVYRGDKVTKRVWSDILAGDYIAQDLVTPTLRGLKQGEGAKELKFDIRVYTYAGKPLLYAGRAYSGQTTNFRTEGGGLAPIIELSNVGCQTVSEECLGHI